MGRLFDDRGNGMTPSHTCKQGVRYRYYLSSAILQGQAQQSGSVRRVAVTEIENLVIQSVRDHDRRGDIGLLNLNVAMERRS